MKSKRNALLPVVLLACFVVPLFGQAPLLSISKPIAMSRTLSNGRVYHYWLVPLTNNYHAAVTALAIDFDGHVPGRGILDRQDSIPSSGARTFPSLGPFSSSTVQVAARGGSPPTAVNIAVIYSDGATAGDPATIAHFLLARAVFLGAIPPTVARLRAIAADPGADRTQALAHFQQEASIEKSLLGRDGLHWGLLPRVSGLVAINLKYRPNVNMQQVATNLADVLEQWRVKLEQSKPKLSIIPFPASGS